MIEALPPGAFGSAVTGIHANMAHRACKAGFWKWVRFRLSRQPAISDSKRAGPHKTATPEEFVKLPRLSPQYCACDYLQRQDASISRSCVKAGLCLCSRE